MKMLKLPALLTSLAAVLVFAASALAAHKSGAYEGNTEQGATIKFGATAKLVKKLSFADIVACDSGLGSKGTFENVHGPIKNDRFKISAKFNSGATKMTITGAFSGTFAGGTITDVTRLDTEGNPNPEGTVHCKAKIRWTASLG